MTAPAPEKAAPIPADGPANTVASILAWHHGRPVPTERDRVVAAEIVEALASQEERIREDERQAATDAKAVIGRLQTLVYNVRGWVSRGQSETALKTMDAAMVDGWVAMGWRQYLEAERARLRGGAS